MFSGCRYMLKLFNNNQTQDRIQANAPSNVINQAITHSMIQGDDALNNSRFADAHRFYRYALQLSEMHFGESDSVVDNLRSLLKALDDILGRGKKRAPALVQKQ
jgi:hypothetical protein